MDQHRWAGLASACSAMQPGCSAACLLLLPPGPALQPLYASGANAPGPRLLLLFARRLRVGWAPAQPAPAAPRVRPPDALPEGGRLLLFCWVGLFVEVQHWNLQRLACFCPEGARLLLSACCLLCLGLNVRRLHTNQNGLADARPELSADPHICGLIPSFPYAAAHAFLSCCCLQVVKKVAADVEKANKDM